MRPATTALVVLGSLALVGATLLARWAGTTRRTSVPEAHGRDGIEGTQLPRDHPASHCREDPMITLTRECRQPATRLAATMNCPRCEQDTLIEIDRQGITIDRCDKCRGVWLDRGELEKLVAKGASGDDRDRGRDRDNDDRDRRRRDDDDDEGGGRRGGFWSNLFDFD